MTYIRKISEKFFSDLVKKNNLFYIFFAIIIFSLDRLSKNKIITQSTDKNQIYVNNYINLDLVWNTGIGFGIFSTDSNLIYHSITGIIAVVISFIIYLIIKANLHEKLFFTLILGGALGNFYDRLIYFAVPDFIDIHYGNFHWFTFNIADIFITIGIIMLIFNDIFFKNEKN